MDTAQFEKRYQHKNGSKIWGLVSITLTRDTNNKPLHFVTQILDITERKRNVELLELNEIRLHELINSVTDYIYNVAIENDVVTETTHSDGCIAITGYSPAEFRADKYLWYKIVHDDDKKEVLGQITKLFHNKVEIPLEHRIINKYGNIKWVSNTPVLRFNPEGGLIGYDGLISDITARKNAEEVILKLQKAVESSKTCIIITDAEAPLSMQTLILLN